MKMRSTATLSILCIKNRPKFAFLAWIFHFREHSEREKKLVLFAPLHSTLHPVDTGRVAVARLNTGRNSRLTEKFNFRQDHPLRPPSHTHPEHKTRDFVALWRSKHPKFLRSNNGQCFNRMGCVLSKPSPGHHNYKRLRSLAMSSRVQLSDEDLRILIDLTSDFPFHYLVFCEGVHSLWKFTNTCGATTLHIDQTKSFTLTKSSSKTLQTGMGLSPQFTFIGLDVNASFSTTTTEAGSNVSWQWGMMGEMELVFFWCFVHVRLPS